MTVKIGILQLKTELDDTVRGFTQGLLAEGFAESDFIVDYRNVQGNVPALGQEADDLVASGVDLLFACTTPAAKFAKEATEFYGTPVVFTPVYDPVALGLVGSWEKSGNHLTGVSGKVEATKKLELMCSLRPGLTQVTVVYDPDDPNSVLELTDLARGAAEMSIAVTETKVHDPSVLRRLQFSAGCQFVFVTIGRMFEEDLSDLADNCLAQAMPLCGHNLAAVLAGAACCVEASLYDLGYQSGLIAARIFKGADPATLPIEQPANQRNYLNQAVAKKLGLAVDGVEAEIIEGR